MANIFVNDDGSNTSPYETWAKAATAMATAVTAAGSGDDIIIGSDHTETINSVLYTFATAGETRNRVISSTVGAGSAIVYNKADNAQVITNNVQNLGIAGHVDFYGIQFQSGNDFQMITTPSYITFDDSIIDVNGFNDDLALGQTSGGQVSIHLRNTDVRFSAATGDNSRRISNHGATFVWEGGAISWTNTQPVKLFDSMDRSLQIHLAGVDLSAITTVLFDIADVADINTEFHQCLLNSGVALTTGTIGSQGTRLLFSGCDDTTGNDLYRLDLIDFWGSTVHDDVIFRDSGASDGTTNISWKMISTANAAEFNAPTKSPPIYAWVDATGSTTFTVHLNWDNATDLDNDEVWLEIEFLEASADTDSAFADDRMADVTATPAAQATSTEAWTGTSGFTNENKQQLDVVVTVNRVGPVIARVCLAKPSTTIYADPKLEIA